LTIIAWNKTFNILETKTDTKDKHFAIILYQHRLWGSVILPYIIQKVADRGYYKLSECLSPFPNIDTLSTLTSEELELVKIINEYTDRNLFKLFSRDKSVKEFLENITAEKLEKFIRPFIERRLYKCFAIARDENIPLYFQKTISGNLHTEDKLFVSEEKAEPVFRFIRNEEQSAYSLKLESGGKLIELRNSSVDIICMAPCLIRKDHRILFVSDIDGSKLKPFLFKENSQKGRTEIF
jgi:hypothetical protein